MMFVSIHAPAWGATVQPPEEPPIVVRFNPRPRVGGDVLATATNKPRSGVSIHAPAWGATAISLIMRRSVLCFNPRPRVGGD